MKFLIDAQLPLRLSNLLTEADHDSIHTSSLPDGNRTSDRQLADIADNENRVVVTKDRDFRDSHLLSRAVNSLLKCGMLWHAQNWTTQAGAGIE